MAGAAILNRLVVVIMAHSPLAEGQRKAIRETEVGVTATVRGHPRRAGISDKTFHEETVGRLQRVTSRLIEVVTHSPTVIGVATRRRTVMSVDGRHHVTAGTARRLAESVRTKTARDLVIGSAAAADAPRALDTRVMRGTAVTEVTAQGGHRRLVQCVVTTVTMMDIFGVIVRKIEIYHLMQKHGMGK